MNGLTWKLDANIRLPMTAFSTSRQTSTSEMDSRLEYLFWRIWSSRNLLDKTDITGLDNLVTRIMASEPLEFFKSNQQQQVSIASSHDFLLRRYLLLTSCTSPCNAYTWNYFKTGCTCVINVQHGYFSTGGARRRDSNSRQIQVCASPCSTYTPSPNPQKAQHSAQ